MDTKKHAWLELGKGDSSWTLIAHGDLETIARIQRIINPQIKKIIADAKRVKENPAPKRPCGCPEK